MNILALDCSTKSTGFAIYKEKKLIEHGCITSSSGDLFVRIHKMVDEINKLIQKYDITQLILEEVRPDDIGARSNLNTHRALMWLQGAVAMMVHDNYPKLKTHYFYPSEWRKLCGIQTGRGVVRETVKQRDIQFVQETFKLKVNDDEADAIGLGYAFLHPEEEEISGW